MALKTDYKDYIPPSGGRKYKITANSDGSSSVEDITQYQQVGDTWGAEDINQVNKLVNGAVYPNLLDNSNFNYPVNQRDGTSYSTSTGNAAYSIDRWRIEGATYTVATHTLSGTSYTNRACRMAQFIEMAQYGLNIGDDMTFSIMANGTKHSATAKILDRDQYSSFENVPSAYSCDDFDIVLCTGLGKPSILSFTICAKKIACAGVGETRKRQRGHTIHPQKLRCRACSMPAIFLLFGRLEMVRMLSDYGLGANHTD